MSTNEDKAIPTTSTKTHSKHRGRLLIVFCAVMWSTSGLFAKAPVLTDWPESSRGMLLAFWRATFAGFFLLPFSKKITWTWKLIPATLIFAVMNISYLTAITKTTAANSIWLQSTSPIWVFLCGYIFLRQNVQKSDWVMLVFGVLGIGTILSFELTSSLTTPSSREGVAWALFSGVTLAAVVFSLRWLREHNSVWLIAIYHIVTMLLLLPWVLYQGIQPTLFQCLWLFLFGVFQMGLPYVLFARGLKQIPSHEAAFLILLEPILVPVWVWLAWRNHESYQAPAIWTFVGAAFILVGLGIRFGGGLWRSHRR